MRPQQRRKNPETFAGGSLLVSGAAIAIRWRTRAAAEDDGRHNQGRPGVMQLKTRRLYLRPWKHTRFGGTPYSWLRQ